MQPERIRLTYTDPITGEKWRRGNRTAFLTIDGVSLQITHTGLWTAHPYREGIDARAVNDWIRSDDYLSFVARRRADLLDQIAAAVGTDAWTRMRDTWTALPRKRHTLGP